VYGESVLGEPKTWNRHAGAPASVWVEVPTGCTGNRPANAAAMSVKATDVGCSPCPGPSGWAPA